MLCDAKVQVPEPEHQPVRQRDIVRNSLEPPLNFSYGTSVMKQRETCKEKHRLNKITAGCFRMKVHRGT